jgi:hypothetical protein
MPGPRPVNAENNRYGNRDVILTFVSLIATLSPSRSLKRTPYIFIFNLGELEIADMDEDADGALLTVSYSVANYGKIPAIIKYAQAVLAIAEAPPLPNRVPESHSLIAAPILAANEVRPGIEQSYVWFGGYEFDADGMTIPSIPVGSVLFLWIIITYRGPFTDQHETRACWIYNETTNRFSGPWGTQEYSGEK